MSPLRDDTHSITRTLPPQKGKSDPTRLDRYRARCLQNAYLPALVRRGAPGEALKVAEYLARFSVGICWASRERIAADVGLIPVNVSRAFRWLRAAGFLMTVSGPEKMEFAPDLRTRTRLHVLPWYRAFRGVDLDTFRPGASLSPESEKILPPLPPRKRGGGRSAHERKHRTRTPALADPEALRDVAELLEAIRQEKNIPEAPSRQTARRVLSAAAEAAVPLPWALGFLSALARRGEFDRARGFGLVVYALQAKVAGAFQAEQALRAVNPAPTLPAEAGPAPGAEIAQDAAAAESTPAHGPEWEAAVRRAYAGDPERAEWIISRRRQNVPSSSGVFVLGSETWKMSHCLSVSLNQNGLPSGAPLRQPFNELQRPRHARRTQSIPR
jgi:hypothetical protein